MNPELTPQSTGGVQPQQQQAQAQPQQSQALDPSVVALTKAIGHAETPKFGTAAAYTTPSGDPGSPASAYQFTPAFLQEWAPKAGVQYNGQQLTPAQQDEIAYNAVKTMGTTGDPAYPHLGKLTPAQIASAWNSGDPNAYLNSDYKGVNSTGQSYDVPAYVSKVEAQYNKLNPQASQTASNPLVPSANAATSPSTGSSSDSSQPGWLSALEGIGLGGVGWLAGQAGNYVKNAIPDVATDATIGAVGGTGVEPGGGTLIGGLGGAATGLVQAGIQTAIQDATGGNSQQSSGGTTGTNDTGTQQTQTQPDLGSALPESAAASDAVRNAINESLQSTQTGRMFSQSKDGQEAIQTAAQFGLINPDSEGNLQFNEDKLKQAQAEIGNAQDAIIKANGGTASPVSVANYGGSYIGKDKTATVTDRQKAAEIMKSELTADSQGIPANGQMSLEDMRTAQKTHYTAAHNAYKKGNFSVTPEMLAHKALGNAYGRTIRDNMKDPELYDKTKKMEQNLINAKQVGKKLNGKKAPKAKGVWESFLRQGARAAEIYIGDRLGGPVGAIIAGFAGEHLNRKIDQKFGRNIFETKGMKAALDILKDSKPKEYKDIVAALKKHGINATDESEVPTSEQGIKKDIQKDEKSIGKKGLIEVPYKGKKPQ